MGRPRLPRENGTPFRPARISQEFAALVKKADVPSITLHGQRHTHATLALEAEAASKIAALVTS